MQDRLTGGNAVRLDLMGLVDIRSCQDWSASGNGYRRQIMALRIRCLADNWASSQYRAGGKNMTLVEGGGAKYRRRSSQRGDPKGALLLDGDGGVRVNLS